MGAGTAAIRRGDGQDRNRSLGLNLDDLSDAVPALASHRGPGCVSSTWPVTARVLVREGVSGPATNGGNTKVLWTVAGKVAHPLQ